MKYYVHKRFFLLFILSFCLVLFFVPSVLADNTLKVGMLKNDAPLSSIGSKHQVHGANVTVAKELASNFDKKTKIVTFKNNKQLTKQLRAGKIDFALGSFPQKNDSKNNYQLSQPFFYVENVLFRRADGTKNSVDKLIDKKVGLLKKGTQGPLLDELGFKNRRYSSISDMIRGLQEKQIKAAILTGPQYASFLQKHPEYQQAKDQTDRQQTQQILKRIKDPQITAQKVSVETYNSKKLAHKINNDLQKMEKDGRLNKISVKYFGKDITHQ